MNCYHQTLLGDGQVGRRCCRIGLFRHVSLDGCFSALGGAHNLLEHVICNGMLYSSRCGTRLIFTYNGMLYYVHLSERM